MQSQWLAVDGTTSPRARARQLHRAWEHLLADAPVLEGRLAGAVREPIAESWQRSLSAGLDPAGWLAPVEEEQAETRERWEQHPLGSIADVLVQQLQLTDEDQNLIVLSDAAGLLLHVQGSDRLKERAASEMNFVEGARWSEGAAGTNAVGLALAADHCVQVFASEHFNENVHAWTCSAAPVHDPVSGVIVGVVDLTGPLETVHPLSLALAATVATTMEHALAEVRREKDSRLRQRYGDLSRTTNDLLVSDDGRLLVGAATGRESSRLVIPEGGGAIVLDDGSAAVAEPLGRGEAYLVRGLERRSRGAARSATLRFEAFGRDRVEVQAGERTFTLSRRHSEIVVLLAEHADGLTAEELAVALYGDHAKPVSARAEVSRLRALLGTRIGTEPYRLEPPVESDIGALRRLLRQGRVAEAAALHVDVLLPRSEAPGVIELREELEAWMRRAVMTADDVDALWTWISSPPGTEDLPAWVRFLSSVPYDDGRRALAAAHVTRLRRRFEPTIPAA